MFLGVDRIFKRNKYIIFIIASAILATSLTFNAYYLYIVTIFTFIYAIIKYFSEYKNNGKKDFCIEFIKMLLCYIIGVLFTSLVLLHTINIFKNTSINIDLGFTYYDFKYCVRSLFMSSKTAYWTKPYVLPIFLTVLPIALLNFKKNKENRTMLITLLVLTLLFIIPWTSYALNGFVFETNKWSFVFSFVLAYIVTINIRDNLTYSPREFKFVKKSLILYLVIWFLFRSNIGNFPVTTFVFAFMYLIIIWARSLDYKELKENQQFEYAESLKGPKSSIIKTRVKFILLLALCLNIVFFSWQLYSRLKYAREFTSFKNISTIADIELPNNYQEVNFDFSGKYKDKIINENSLKITKNYKSFNLKITDNIPENSVLYLVVDNLKYTVNDEYSIAAKYNGITSKKTIFDKVKTPNYIHNENIIFKLGEFNNDSNTIKITFSSRGVYNFDSIKLLAVQNK